MVNTLMLKSTLDHLVVTAESLSAGVNYVEQILGAAMQPGGEHVRMGTHNALLKIGPASYLEVIAVNPEASPVRRARWFALDNLEHTATPRLATWVVRTSSVERATQRTPFSLGDIEPMSRGSLEWRITIPQNGSLPFEGIAPMLIEWGDNSHPAAALPESGVSLVQLEGFHPMSDEINAMLRRIGFEGNVAITGVSQGEGHRLIASFRTRAGIVKLS